MGWSFYQVRAADLRQPLYGNTEAAVIKTFSAVSLHTPVLVFFDECDDLLGIKGMMASDAGGGQNLERALALQVIELVQGGPGKDGNYPGVFFFFATNNPGALEDSFKSRLDPIDMADTIKYPLTVSEFVSGVTTLLRTQGDNATLDVVKNCVELKEYLNLAQRIHLADWRVFRRAIESAWNAVSPSGHAKSNFAELMTSGPEQLALNYAALFPTRPRDELGKEEASILTTRPVDFVKHMTTFTGNYIKNAVAEREGSVYRKFATASYLTSGTSQQQRAAREGVAPAAAAAARTPSVQLQRSTAPFMVPAGRHTQLLPRPLPQLAPSRSTIVQAPGLLVPTIAPFSQATQQMLMHPKSSADATRELEQQQQALRERELQLFARYGTPSTAAMRDLATKQANLTFGLSFIDYDMANNQLMRTREWYERSGINDQERRSAIDGYLKIQKSCEKRDNKRIVADLLHLVELQEESRRTQLRSLRASKGRADAGGDDDGSLLRRVTVNDIRVGSDKVGVLFHLVMQMRHGHVQNQFTLLRRILYIVRHTDVRDQFFTREGLNALGLIVSDPDLWYGSQHPEYHEQQQHVLMQLLRIFTSKRMRHVDPVKHESFLSQALEFAVTRLKDTEAWQKLLDRDARLPTIAIASEPWYIRWNSLQMAPYLSLQYMPPPQYRLFVNTEQAMEAAESVYKKYEADQRPPDDENWEVDEEAEVKAEVSPDAPRVQHLGRIKEAEERDLGITLDELRAADEADAPPRERTYAFDTCVRLRTVMLSDIVAWFPQLLLAANNMKNSQRRQCFAVSHMSESMPATVQVAFYVAATTGRLDVVQAIAALTLAISSTLDVTQLANADNVITAQVRSCSRFTVTRALATVVERSCSFVRVVCAHALVCAVACRLRSSM